ncbi:MAG: helix-turn-helix domain-containing protein [Bacteroidaceae bacterium]|nr:helix-turn-helix domain-containing protein [Bacteroidaceae bacterium]
MIQNLMNQARMGTITITVNPQDLHDMIVLAVQEAVGQSKKDDKQPHRTYLTSDEVMEHLNISRSTLDRKRKMGILVPVKIGKLNRYRIEDVELFERLGE